MNMQRQQVFDIDKIYLMLHKREGAGFRFECRARAWDGFVTVTDGECVFSDENGEQTLLTKGGTVFLRRDETYTISGTEPFAYYTTAFDFSPESDETLKMLPKTAVCGAMQLKSIEQMIESRQSQSAQSYMFCKIGLLKLYYEIMGAAQDGGIYHSDEAVNRAMKFLHDNFKRNFKSAEIAAYCSLSESHLRKKFVEETGATIWEYRDALRFGLAREMLSSGVFSVKEAAYELGFCDVYYFTKFFIKHCGVAPGRFISAEAQKHGR